MDRSGWNFVAGVQGASFGEYPDEISCSRTLGNIMLCLLLIIGRGITQSATQTRQVSSSGNKGQSPEIW